jgi:hypothetical protein
MKRILILCATAFAFAFLAGGCADPLEQNDVQDAGNRLQHGLSGQGHLTPDESTNNPTGAPSESETPPQYPPQ